MATFSVIISEKGGSERRETFDRSEINVGRVQGNDLMLPKGNVSKRHARLLWRDGRFIVTDLKSTNGTYVNGRKIAQATIVREGDKIYIGDFVLRVEAGGASAPSAPPPVALAAPADDAASDLQLAPPALDAAEQAPRSVPPGATSPPAAPGRVPSPASFESAAPAPAPAPDVPSPVPSDPPAIPPPPAVPPLIHAAPIADAGLEALAPRPASIPVDPPSSQPSSPERSLKPPAPRIDRPDNRQDIISHFPLEHDPDESVHFAVPAPPRVPSAPRLLGGKTLPVPASAPVVPRAGSAPGPTAPPTPFALPALPQPPSAPPRAAPAMSPPAAPPTPAQDPPTPPYDRATSPSMGLGALGIAPAPRRVSADGKGSDPALVGARPRAASGVDPAPAQAGRRAALGTLVARVHERVDLALLDDGSPPDAALGAQIERAVAEVAASLRDGAEVDVDAIALEARRELLELGPLAALLEDDDVTEIHVTRHDHVVGVHAGRHVPLEVAFTSEAALGRVIRRLCRAAGAPLAGGETFVERRLARGHRLVAILPHGEERGHALTVRKPHRAEASLEDLVRSGTISRAIASVLGQCVAARANVLVAGAGATTLLGALVGAGGADDRVVVLQGEDELALELPHAIAVSPGGSEAERTRAVEVAARLRPDRLVVASLAGAAAARLVDAASGGLEGVVAGARAPSLRQALARLTADVAARSPGVPMAVAGGCLASAFDLAVEVARLRDGRHRVLRVAELVAEGDSVGIRDVFTFTVERTAAGGAIEGSFGPTGVVPRVLEDLAARGAAAVDTSIFRRHVRADGADADAGLGSLRPADPPRSPPRP